VADLPRPIRAEGVVISQARLPGSRAITPCAARSPPFSCPERNRLPCAQQKAGQFGLPLPVSKRQKEV